MTNNYEANRTKLAELNARIHALKAPAMDAGTAAHVEFNALRRSLRIMGEEAGFVRIFDGSFKLNAKQVAEQ